MKHVAKLILIDEDGRNLLLTRSKHPSFPYDPDLPGGTLEKGEDPLRAVVREVAEETGIALNPKTVEKVYESNQYDENYTYYLYKARCDMHPAITISWEHSSFQWLAASDFEAAISKAIDRYMQMVHDYLLKNTLDGQHIIRR